MRVLFIVLLLWHVAIPWAQQRAQQPDYSKPTAWYAGQTVVDKGVDVLFFPPTAVSDKDGQGHNMNPDNSTQRAAINYWYAVAKQLFGESCNFYGPYYRQVTMESWGSSAFNERYAIALGDAQAAFDYYIQHLNNGRPFILAGHSQGAGIVYSLIKTRINQNNHSQMVAAYPIGYRVTAAELKACPYILPARGATDIGVCVSYHTAANPKAAMYAGNAFSINPMNWATDSTIAKEHENLGSVFFDQTGKIVREIKQGITARLDPKTTAVIVSGLDPKEFFKPYVGGYTFRLGNYHLQDLNIFFRNLQQNVKDRIASYNFKNRK